MEAQQLTIESKHRQYHRFLASLKDFSYHEGTLVDPSLVVKNPQISLYCLDDSSQQALFVEIPPGIDLAKVPFVCRTQYEQAQQLITVPYETFNQLADHLPQVQRPIFIYTTGRSGSTLLHQAFNESQIVLSLSEPDVATQFANLRHNTKGNRDAELRKLANSSIRFLFRNYHTQGVQAHALKFRSHGTQVMDLFQTIFPETKNIFLYRQAIAYVTSSYRIYQKNEYPVYPSFQVWQSQFEQFWGADLSDLVKYVDEECEAISILKELTLEWIVGMEWYIAQVERGTPALALRYADLIDFQEETLKKIFSYCHLPLNRVQQALNAYSRDSQAGTPLGRENPQKGNKYTLNETQIDLVTGMLQRHSVLNMGYRPQGDKLAES